MNNSQVALLIHIRSSIYNTLQRKTINGKKKIPNRNQLNTIISIFQTPECIFKPLALFLGYQ